MRFSLNALFISNGIQFLLKWQENFSFARLFFAFSEIRTGQDDGLFFEKSNSLTSVGQRIFIN